MGSKMTDSEIIKALQCCRKCITTGSTDKDCPNCPLYNIDGCCDMLIVALADFVKRLQTENEKLKEENLVAT